MLREGYTLTYRASYFHPIVGKDRPLRHFTWRWMVDLAFFNDSGDIKRGQFKATCRELAEVWGMPLATFHRFKRELVEACMVEVIDGPTRRAPSLWTIVNYDRFQAERTTERTTERKRNANGTQESQPTTGKGDTQRNANGTQTERTAERTTERPKKENSLELKLLEDPPKPPKGEAASAAGGEGKTKPKKGDTPSVPSAGGWPGLPTNAKATGFEYPAEFLEIWNYWRSAAKMNPEVKRQAVGKWNAYRRILEWLNDGLTAAEIAAATRDYLRPFCVDRKKTHCKMPATIYSRANPILPDLCDDSEATGGSVNLRPWSNPISAFVEVNRAAKRLGLPLPTFRKFSATWEQIESMPAEVLEEARRNA